MKFSKRLGRLLALIELASQLRRERQHLLALSDRQLADIGINRAQARDEAGRGLFDVPANRLKRRSARTTRRRADYRHSALD